MPILLPNSGWSNNNVGNELAGAFTSLTEYPAEITLSENVNNFKFEPLLSGTLGNKANALMQVTAYVPVGSTVTITSQYATATLTASANPSASEFYTSATPIATPAYLQQVAYSIADTLNQMLSFSTNYEIGLLGTQISILAKQSGSNYDTTTVASGAYIFTLDIAGNAEFESQTVIDYKGFIEVYVGNQSYADSVDKYTCIKVDEYVLDTATDDVNINVPVVSDFVEPILPVKVLTPSANYFAMDSGVTGSGAVIPSEDAYGNAKFLLRPYFLAYGDSFKYVINGQRKKYIRGVSPIRWVQLGAFDKLMPYAMIDYTWLPNGTKDVSFMTSCPNMKTVSYESHEFLQVIAKKTAVNNNFNINVKWKFYDGTYLIENKASFPYQDVSGNISFDVSPKVIDVNGIEVSNGKLVDSYEIRLKWSSNGVNELYSESKSYVMDRTCYFNAKQIVFLNQFGAWDSLEFRGHIEESLNREILTIQRSLPSNANTLDGVSTEVTMPIGMTLNSLYTLRSGLINDSHIDWIKILGESTSVYIWDSSVNKYRNIIIQEFDYLDNTISTSDSVSIVFTYSTDNNYTSR